MNNNKKTINLRWLMAFIALPILTACQSTGSTEKIVWGAVPVQCMVDANTEIKIDKSLPQAVKRVEPHYPMSAQRNGISGCTKMLFDLTPLGAVTNIRIVGSWPKRVFEKSSVKSLKRWVYSPTERGAKDLEMRLDYQVSK
ncbi:MAG: energy transducer TonB [Algicola sp.]|nr:energy transducer TonB [Algicola sp.]